MMMQIGDPKPYKGLYFLFTSHTTKVIYLQHPHVALPNSLYEKNTFLRRFAILKAYAQSETDADTRKKTSASFAEKYCM